MVRQKILLALFVFFTLNLFSQKSQQLDKVSITKMLNQYSSEDTPGMAVGIVKDGKIVYEHYVGNANMEHKVKIDKDTRFNIASNAKQFTALCILKLVEQGKVNLEDDFRKYLPNIHQNIQDKITISNLLTHTSGVRDYCDLLALTGKTWWQQFINNGDALELLEGQKDLNFKPGTEYLYSNSNYILLTEIVKKVSGQKFSEFSKDLFEALEMPNTSFLTHYGTIVPNRARAYGNWDGWNEAPAIVGVHGDGALFTTLNDQLKWEQIIQDNNGKYFSKKLIMESQSPLASSIENSYGYGLFFEHLKGLDYSFHDGATGPYNATFLRFPTKNISIVIMSNGINTSANYLAWQIAFPLLGWEEEEGIYPGKPDKIEALKQIQDVLGIYKNEAGTIIKITEKDGSLYREMSQRDPVKLIKEQGGLFEYETIKGLKMNFTNISKTNQQFTIYLSSQAPNTYHKLSDLDQGHFDKKELNARFYNEETGTEIILKHLEDNTYSLTKNGRERKADLIFKDYLRMMSSYEIKIIRDQQGNVIGLNVRNNRIKNVIFKRT